MGVFDLADRSWPLLRRLMAGHTAVYRTTTASSGIAFRALPTCSCSTTQVRRAARSAPARWSTSDGEDLVLVASKGGHPRNPAWFHNLRAHPETTVQVGRERRAVHARVATETERPRLWQKAVDTYGGYREYQERTRREIPLVVLERRASRSRGATSAMANCTT